MYTPYLNDLARLHMNELAAEARHAKRCRELAGPSRMCRLVTKLRRPSTGTDQRRPTPSVVAGRVA
jgi:hypothetical protein